MTQPLPSGLPPQSISGPGGRIGQLLNPLLSSLGSLFGGGAIKSVTVTESIPHVELSGATVHFSGGITSSVTIEGSPETIEKIQRALLDTQKALLDAQVKALQDQLAKLQAAQTPKAPPRP